MKKNYAIKRLFRGNIAAVTREGRDIFEEASKEWFLFEKIMGKCMEVFTNTPIPTKRPCYFNAEYLVNIEPIPSDLLTEKELKAGYVSKIRLLQIYNQLNFIKDEKKLVKEQN